MALATPTPVFKPQIPTGLFLEPRLFSLITGYWWLEPLLRIGALLRNNLAPINKQLSFPGGSEVKSLPAMWETHVKSLDWEDLLEKANPMNERVWRAKEMNERVHRVAKSRTRLSN